MTDLFEAVRNGQLEVLKQNLTSPKVVNRFGNSLLHEAVLANQYHCAEYLIKQGALVNQYNCDGLTPLHMAAQSNSLQIAKLLIDAGASKECNSLPLSQTPLQLAVINNNIEVARLLLQKISHRHDLKRRSSIMKACIQNNNVEMMTLLVTSNRFSKEYLNLAYLHAARCGKPQVLRFLVKQGIDVNTRDEKGRTALIAACQHVSEGHLACAEILLRKSGLKVNVYDSAGLTALHNAVIAGNVCGVERLTKQRLCNINMPSYHHQRTPLMYAVGAGEGHKPNATITELLLNKKAQVDYKDLMGATAATYATLRFSDDAGNTFKQLVDTPQKTVYQALVEYERNCKKLSTKFSLFHRHSGRGEKRARQFYAEIQRTPRQAQHQAIIDYLCNDSNGNTHPHSFRTLLLQTCLLANNDKFASSQQVSNAYQGRINQLKYSWGIMQQEVEESFNYNL